MTGSVGLDTLLMAFSLTCPTLWSVLLQRVVKLKGCWGRRRLTNRRLGGEGKCQHRAQGGDFQS